MSETILLGRGDQIIEIPRQEWEASLHPAAHPEHHGFSFITAEHQRVRYFVVAELPRRGQPLQPETISARLGIPLDRTNRLLDDLEKHLTFLVRNDRGAVVWAFPVTVEPTPHALSFRSGERLYAA